MYTLASFPSTSIMWIYQISDAWCRFSSQINQKKKVQERWSMQKTEICHKIDFFHGLLCISVSSNISGVKTATYTSKYIHGNIKPDIFFPNFSHLNEEWGHLERARERVKPLVLYMESSQLFGWLDQHLNSFQACATGKRPQGRSRRPLGYYKSPLAREYLKNSPERTAGCS